MKKIILIFIGVCIFFNVNGQTEKDVYDAKTVYFYGYDYTGLRVADGTRIGQNLMPFFPATAKLLEKEFGQKDMEIKLRKGKGGVPYNIAPASSQNEKINNGKIVAEEPRTLSPDSLAAMVKRYQLPETEGIGYTIVFECFNRADQTISLHLVFFDIATRKIICTKYVVSHDGNGYNYMGDWKKASIKAVDRLLAKYIEDFNGYKKGTKTEK